jgi:heterokaryon incompatibility protein (HET)
MCDAGIFSIPSESLMIDVSEQCLVDMPGDCEYVTLSYTWGTSPQFLTTEQELEQLKAPGALVDKPIPRTVRDAISLTEKIGFRYLWVDALCIIQDSESHKRMQISKMHLIYARGAVTVVAASSSDANDGLPGVRLGTRKWIQCMAGLNGLRFLAASNVSNFTNIRFEDSLYSTRAWTYQESLMSCRLLYIFPDEVVFECNEALCKEFLIQESDACQKACARKKPFDLQENIWSIKGNGGNAPCTSCECSSNLRQLLQEASCSDSSLGIEKIAVSQPLCGDCEDSMTAWDEELSLYGEIVWEYTSRHMKYESDRLNAFAGITRILQQQFNTSFIHGLPERFFDAALTWSPRQNRSTPCRRKNLTHIPTWSWASYEISVDISNLKIFVSEVDWYRVDEQHELRQVRSLRVRGPSFDKLRSDFVKPVPKAELEVQGLCLDDEVPGGAIFGYCQLSTTFFAKWDSEVDLWDLFDKGKQPVARLHYRGLWFSDKPPEWGYDYVPVELLCLCRSGSRALNIATVLLIEREGQVARRLAIATLEVGFWEEAVKEWVLIKLI